MIGRAVLVAVAAAAFTLAPATAMATVPAGFRAPVVETAPAPAAPFNVKASGARAGEAVTLTMTRDPMPGGTAPTKLTKTANAKGAVVFAVTLTEDGTYALVSTSASGKVLGEQSVTVTDNGAILLAGESADGALSSADSGGASASADSDGASVSADSGGASASVPAARGPARAPARPAAQPQAAPELALTGFRGMGLAVGGGAFILAGAGLILVARPRKPAHVRGRDVERREV